VVLSYVELAYMVAGEGTELRGGEGSGAEDMVHMAGCIGEETEYFVQGGG
jgi:hypothetical protein